MTSEVSEEPLLDVRLPSQALSPLPATDAEDRERKVTVCVYDKVSVQSNVIEFIFFVVIFILLFVILILCVLYFTVNTGPNNLGATLCCSPASMYRGQRLQNGIWSLQLDSSGVLSLYKNDPHANPPVSLVWSTKTAEQNVMRAVINTNGELQLVNQEGIVIWNTPLPAASEDIAVPPFRVFLSSDGVTRIISGNNVTVWTQLPEE